MRSAVIAPPELPHVTEHVTDLENTVQAQLNGRVRELRLEIASEGGLVLKGWTRTYHVKQLAQEAVMGATSLPIQANDIEVR